MWRLFGELLLDNSKFPNIANISNSSNRHGGVRGEARFPPLDDLILLQKNIYVILHYFTHIILLLC